MSYQSFAYDKDLSEELTDSAFTRCVVYIRPTKKWEGNNFGFDWIRVGDTDLTGDIHYAENMGKYYTGSGKFKKVQEAGNDYKGDTFEIDPAMYKKLISECFPEKFIIPWKMPKKAKIHGKEWKNNKQRAEYTYYVPVMTLLKGQTAELEFSVELADKKTPPSKIYLQTKQENLFELSYTELKPQKGKYKCSIRCRETFWFKQYINVMVVYDLSEGTEREEICGRLQILPNHLLNDTFKILCVKVKISNGLTSSSGSFTDNDRKNINKVLNQAMLKCEIEEMELTIDVDTELSDPDDPYSSRGTLSRMMDGDEFKRTSGLPVWCLYALKQQMKKSYRQYANHYKLFFLGNEDSKRKDSAGNQIQHTGSTEEEFRAAVLFGAKNDFTTVHELLHAMGLRHSFSAVESHTNAKFTYRAEKTENIMDYSSKRYSIWYWQWKLLWDRCNDDFMLNAPILPDKIDVNTDNYA
jgi:hypothetical protein